MDGWNANFLLGWPIFRCYVSFRECANWDDPPSTQVAPLTFSEFQSTHGLNSKSPQPELSTKIRNLDEEADFGDISGVILKGTIEVSIFNVPRFVCFVEKVVRHS